MDWIQVAQQPRTLGFIESSWVYSPSYYQILVRDYKPYKPYTIIVYHFTAEWVSLFQA